MKISATILFGAAAITVAAPAEAQLRGERQANCISTGSPIIATGKLTVRHFAGPPNYDSIRRGDEDDLVLILRLPRSACIDDHEFDTSHKPLRTVHVWTSDQHLRSKLERLVGHVVSVTGNGYAAHTAHHRAPLLLEAKSATAG